jgi:cysteinyl-tRNA synthetase
MQAMDVVLDIGLRDQLDTGLSSIGVVSEESIPNDVRTLMTARDSARREKNWTESDRLRAEINLLGYAVEDTPHGTKVTKA